MRHTPGFWFAVVGAVMLFFGVLGVNDEAVLGFLTNGGYENRAFAPSLWWFASLLLLPVGVTSVVLGGLLWFFSAHRVTGSSPFRRLLGRCRRFVP